VLDAHALELGADGAVRRVQGRGGEDLDPPEAGHLGRDLQEAHAVHVRQADVQQDEGGSFFCGGQQRFVRGAHLAGPEAAELQHQGGDLRRVLIVFDDQGERPTGGVVMQCAQIFCSAHRDPLSPLSHYRRSEPELQF